ncbi:MFS transporter [Actinocatenispora sera]|uniref:MFS transporter n=1 Tax=Actinocatenispora sera TaxID=390989 RepID=UPI0033FBD3AF
MPALGAYRALFAATGPRLPVLSFLARLPNAMGPLGVLTLLVATTGSYSAAGIATAALGVGAAFGGPAVGALADRYGQRPVGLVAALVDAAGYAGLVAAALLHGPASLVTALATVAGLATPQVGPFMRVRWVHLLRARGKLVPTAFSYEGAVDETSFVAGPALVGLCALMFPPAVPLLIAAALLVVAGLAFALHPTAPAPVAVSGSAAPRARLPRRTVLGLVLAMAALGAIFGGTQTGVTALAGSIGRPGSAGLIYAVLGVGSATAGLATAWLPARFRYPARYLVFAAALAVAVTALLTISGPAGAIAAMAVLGLLVAPYLITVYALAERIAPPGRTATVLTLLAAGIVAGVALGAGLAGTLADRYGFRGAFAVPVAAGLIALLLAATAYRRLARTSAGLVAPGAAAGDSAPRRPESLVEA